MFFLLHIIFAFLFCFCFTFGIAFYQRYRLFGNNSYFLVLLKIKIFFQFILNQKAIFEKGLNANLASGICQILKLGVFTY